MSAAPPLTFDVGSLLDDEKMKNGPLDFFWNQDEWIPPADDADFPEFDATKRPPRYWRARIFGCRQFVFAVRITPPPDTDLSEWGHAVAERMGVPWTNEPKEGHRAVWLPGVVMARSAGGALGSCKRVFDKLEGFKVGSVAIRTVAASSTERTSA